MPKAVAPLVKSGVAVVVESGAGERALLPDELYTEAGATIGDAWAADIVVKVAPPTADEVGEAHRRPDADRLPGAPQRRQLDRRAQGGRRAGVRAGSHPADLAGAGDGRVVVAGQRRRLQGGAAGRVGVDPVLPDADHRGGHREAGDRAGARRRCRGLQALATAKRLGGTTTGYDVRPEVADQVRSVGAQWLDLGIDAAGEGGYARELTDEERAQQQKALEEAISGFDVVITTALVPGPSGAAAGDRRRGRGDEARQRGRRPGR